MTTTIARTTVQHLPRAEIRPGPWQPRRVFDEASLAELAASIREHGVLVPLRVARADSGIGYYLVAGERRWRAAELAGLDVLPCLVVEGADERAIQLQAILDNLHREDLRPGEEAQGLQLLAELGLSQREIAEQLGKSQAWVSQRLGLLKLPPSVRDALDHGVITVEDARELQKLAKWPELVEAVLDREGGQKAINRWLGQPAQGWLPADVPGRVKRILDTHSQREERRQTIERLRAEGKTVLEGPELGDGRGYVELYEFDDRAKAHAAAGLSCEAYVVTEYGYVRRYCSDPDALAQAVKAWRLTQPRDAWLVEQEQQRAWRQARDEALRATLRGYLARLERWDPGLLPVLCALAARELASPYPDRRVGEAARMLGLDIPQRDSRGQAAALREMLAGADPVVALRAWVALELADIAPDHVAGVPEPVQRWLAEQGYQEPPRPDAAIDDAGGVADGHEPGVSEEDIPRALPTKPIAPMIGGVEMSEWRDPANWVAIPSRPGYALALDRLGDPRDPANTPKPRPCAECRRKAVLPYFLGGPHPRGGLYQVHGYICEPCARSLLAVDAEPAGVAS